VKKFFGVRRTRKFYKWAALVSTLFCVGFLVVTLAMSVTLWFRLKVCFFLKKRGKIKK
jgi:uncharacterized membrane protein YciS (DUF1049 family)